MPLKSYLSATRDLKNTLLKQWIFLILVLFVIFFSLAAPGFWSPRNFKSLSVYTTEPLLLALGQTFVIVSGGIDLSVGAILAFCGVVAALVLKAVWAVVPSPVFSICIGVIVGLIAGTLLGGINGTIIAKLRVPPFVVTLGMLGIARGATYLLTSGHSIVSLPPELGRIGNAELFGFLPLSVFVALILVLACHFLLSKTRLGRYTYAIGGSPAAAMRAGIPLDRYTVLIYAISGFTAACAGILIMARFSTGAPIAGMNDELDSIAAVVIGGASLYGGIGNILGSVVGAFIIGVLLVGLIILGVDPYWQMVSVGGILIAAVFIDQMRYRTRIYS
ncbi:MAG: ABC transporter permease [Deltaproteobacteria bacterium]|nr:ABC transporter permease [Deltaproteobacteria bacterium]MBW2122103.1 ABC transporter permease [Deltaproteobacteria bacterium]